MSDRIDFHPRLAEETVWAAVRGGPLEREFHMEREPLYGRRDPEERDRAFGQIAAAWFGRLGLGEAVRQAFLEQGRALDSVERCVAGPAVRDKDEGADLFVADGGGRSIVISIRPETLADADRALGFLRRELTHIADMLDPEFRYEPRLPRQPAGPAHDRLLQDRYRVLWDCSVDGRLVALGRLAGAERARRLAEFRRAFACLETRAEECFGRLFGPARPAHPDLVAMAADPETAFGIEGGSRARVRCGVCSFPTTDLEPDPASLPETVLATVVADVPEWSAALGICRQCADLYRARPLSLAEAGLLPGAAPLEV